MKWRVRKPGAKYRALEMWHDWFAWYPVRVPTKGKMSGMHMVWLEKVRRKGVYAHNFFDAIGFEWEYKYKKEVK